MDPVFFASPLHFRRWLEENHATVAELWVGYHKRATGRESLTWQESVDEALCFGWIDGVRKSLGADSYVIRFTPRRPRSIWSAVNIARVKALEVEGRMRPPGRKAFEARSDERGAVYAYEQRKTAELAGDYARTFRADGKAWEWFQSRPPGYRHLASFWVLSARKEETRKKRLRTLIACSARGLPVPPLRPRGKG